MLELRNACVHIGSRTLLKGVSARLESGSVSVFVGPSGGGKSSILRSLAGIQPLQKGELLLSGLNVEIGLRTATVAGQSIWPRVGLVFQQLFLWPHLRIRENLITGARLDPGDTEIDRLSRQLNVSELLDRFPNEVSVGQRQRVALARAILARPNYLLLDEITSAQDAAHIACISEVLHGQIRNGVALAIVTHHIGFAAELMKAHSESGTVHLVEDGAIVATDKTLDVLSSSIQRLRDYLAAESRYTQVHQP